MFIKVTRNEAKEIIDSLTSQKYYETITIDEAEGRVLFEDMKAKFNIPESDKSAVDGYAINVDNLTFPAKLKIIDEAPAGEAQKELKEGAIFIMTGGVVPKGANAVVRIEDVEKDGDYIVIKKPVKKGDLINFEGEEVKTGDVVLKKGEILDYKKVALLANLGHYQIKVFKKVKIGIVVTGSEVKEPFEALDKAGVKNSNLYILKGLLKPYADITYYGKLPDNLDEMIKVFKNAIEENDILISSGGASKGKYDFTKEIAKQIGVDIKFTTTNIRPGRPLIFGNKDKKLFFGLPGYPAALLVNAVEFLIPYVKKAAGIVNYQNEYKKAVLTTKTKAKEGRVDFIRGNIECDEKVTFTAAYTQQTSNYLSIALSNALAVIDENEGTKEAGEIVEYILI
ncbi:molybdopterin molybdotransferase MoeA [Caminibacter pacificus]|uniref:Molybdopterin molybdenumtransferase n=1 Tax=Caminibacter pacificus TaxID=1424653 RepID=A0AAJ4RBM9_9BACT|nr:molybdopterin molybdotransferase MoeA [Caminibacter pacificus]QCI27495.1 molybdopterin molybdotransferase MoeA [Caminibacter pacificus]ROR38934.1 molybdopterin molybdochelatase [Caminibacter pacificus]